MRKFALLAAVILFVSCYVVNANAAGPTWTTGIVQSEHYVGVTTVDTTGNGAGEVGMNYLCQNQFGATAHICTAENYFATALRVGFSRARKQGTFEVIPLVSSHACSDISCSGSTR